MPGLRSLTPPVFPLLLAVAILGTAAARADEPPPDVWETARRFSFNRPESNLQIRGVFELGLASVISNQYQGSRDGTRFDWVKDGGQGTVIPFTRVSAEAQIFQRHTFILLYQPLDIRTRDTLRAPLRVDGIDFPAGTPMQFRYGFDFYRFSYLYDFLKSPRHEAAIGLSMQMRVANIEFASLDGRLQRASQNIGPVPVVKLRGRYTFDNSAFLGAEIDGIAVQFPSDTGSVLGVLFDVSLRAGYSPTSFLETFINLRYLGGGAKGPGSTPEFGDGYVDNFIHTISASVGITLK